jgi:AraC family transcriptional regulator, arabinose operon regulatory protein
MSAGSALAVGSFTRLRLERVTVVNAPQLLHLDPRVRKVDGLMRRSLHLKLELRQMAAAVMLSASRFSHLFKAQTGISPAQYLKSIRLETAKDLLGGSHFSIKEVAAQVGLEPSRFSRNFREVYGVTPLQYRAAAFNETRAEPASAQL